MTYFLMILMGHGFRIDSPLYASIVSTFLGLVLAVTLIKVLVNPSGTASEVRFLWYVYFAVVLLDQLGAITDAYTANPYFALYAGAVLLVVFCKTVFSRLTSDQKALICTAAFFALVAIRLTALAANVWHMDGAPPTYDFGNRLMSAVASAGGLLYFVNPVRLYVSAAELVQSMSNFTGWPRMAFAASDTLGEGIMFLLPVTAAICLVKDRVQIRKLERLRIQEDEEAAREEQQRQEVAQEQFDLDQAIRMETAKSLVKSAAAGDTKAQHELGMLYINDANFGQAITWLQKAAKNGDLQSQFILGKLYSGDTENYNQTDYPQAYEMLEKAANQDHVEAQFILGRLHFEGAGHDQPNYNRAALWWGRASGNGHLESMGRLAKLHTMADEFPAADAHLAIKLFKKIAHERSTSPKESFTMTALVYPGGQPPEDEKNRQHPRRGLAFVRRARLEELNAELYWLNKSIKQKQKFMEDYADDWDWRNEETKKKLQDDLVKANKLEAELQELTAKAMRH